MQIAITLSFVGAFFVRVERVDFIFKVTIFSKLSNQFTSFEMLKQCSPIFYFIDNTDEIEKERERACGKAKIRTKIVRCEFVYMMCETNPESECDDNLRKANKRHINLIHIAYLYRWNLTS